MRWAKMSLISKLHRAAPQRGVRGWCIVVSWACAQRILLKETPAGSGWTVEGPDGDLEELAAALSAAWAIASDPGRGEAILYG